MYQYEKIKPELFLEKNQETFLKIRDNAHKLLREAGAFKLHYAISNVGGDSFVMLACIDRLVELDEIKEVPTNGMAQDRIFTK